MSETQMRELMAERCASLYQHLCRVGKNFDRVSRNMISPPQVAGRTDQVYSYSRDPLNMTTLLIDLHRIIRKMHAFTDTAETRVGVPPHSLM